MLLEYDISSNENEYSIFTNDLAGRVINGSYSFIVKTISSWRTIEAPGGTLNFTFLCRLWSRIYCSIPPPPQKKYQEYQAYPKKYLKF